MKYLLLIILSFPGFLISSPAFAQQSSWIGFQKDSIYSNMDGALQRFYYYKSTSSEKKPLVVSLHQWSSDYTIFRNSLAPQVKERNWNYIHPDFRGANNNPKACCSKYALDDIDEAIDWALKNLPVDTSRIYVVGASGGGYAALCSFMKSRHRVKEFSVWVPISDLKRWYYESLTRSPKYAGDVIRCTCGNCDTLDQAEAVRRSPLYWETPLKKLKNCRLNIYAGINDGYTGAVPIIHSLAFYNKVVADLGGKMKDQVSCEDAEWMLTTRTAPGKVSCKLGNRDILYFKSYKSVSVTIFDGTHEILVDEVFPDRR